MQITRSILNKFLKIDNNYRLPENRSRIGIFSGWVSIIINLFLFILKITFGVISNSISLIADAFHTLSDVATSAVVVFGFKISQKPPDKEHPFGHGRAEAIATFTIAILIAVMGIEFLRTSIDRYFADATIIKVDSILLFIVISTIIIKELMARFFFDVADIVQSDTIKGDAIHHRGDMMSSVLVLVALCGSWAGFEKLDSLMALGVSLMLLSSAYEIAKNAIDELLGKPVPQQMISAIQDNAKSVKDVINVHDIIVHNYGVKTYISLHLEIDEKHSSAQMHDISDAVENNLSKELHADVVTHIDPVSISGDKIAQIKSLIETTIQDNYLMAEIQDLRLIKGDGVESILFEIPTPVEYKDQDNLEKQLVSVLGEGFPNTKVEIKFKPQITII